MSDTIFSLPIVPTFKEITDYIHNICKNRTSHKLLLRKAIWDTYIALNKINIYSINLSEIDVNDFEDIIEPIFEQISTIVQNYTNDHVLYIKSNRDIWIQEWIKLYQKYNLTKSIKYTKVEIIDFAKQVIEYYNYILYIFENKYKSNF